MTTLLSANGLHKSFGPTVALRGASLDIAERELVAVVGPSGSGKSTLLMCLAGILTPESGAVTWRGRRLDEMSRDGRTRLRRHEFGIILQFGQLVPELTAVENVALPLLLDGHDRRSAEGIAGEWLSRVGAADTRLARPLELSGGQQQRVAIARALVTGPEVVFADEPTGALDTVAGERAMDLLVDTVQETKAALVVVTHDNRVAARAQREVVVLDGRTRPVEMAR